MEGQEEHGVTVISFFVFSGIFWTELEIKTSFCIEETKGFLCLRTQGKGGLLYEKPE